MSNLIRCHWALAVALAVAYLLSGKPLHAAEYYIDQAHPSANDANSGTASLPWKTITKANASLMPGDTVYIKAGTYNQYISPARSGTAGNLITFRNYSNDTVRITGHALCDPPQWEDPTSKFTASPSGNSRLTWTSTIATTSRFPTAALTKRPGVLQRERVDRLTPSGQLPLQLDSRFCVCQLRNLYHR